MSVLAPLLQFQKVELLHLYQENLLTQQEPDLAKMKLCPQNPKWHAEGDVLVHTQMVLEEGFRLLSELPSLDEKAVLLLACVLHDIGKPLVTNSVTLSAAGHENAGVTLAGKILNRLNVSLSIKTRVLDLVRDHGVPSALVRSKARDASYRRLALRCSCKMLYYLEKADYLGREGETKQESLDLLEKFKEKTQHLGLFEDSVPRELQQFSQLLKTQSFSPLKTQWLLNQCVPLWLNGRLPSTLQEPLLQRYFTLLQPPWLVYTMGVSGSGKSIWAQRQKDFFLISTDQTRKELLGSEEDLTQERAVFALGYEKMREALKEKRSVLWDATNISYRARARLLNHAQTFHPCIALIFFPLNLEASFQQNEQRLRQVPKGVLLQQAAQFVEPKFHEYNHLFSVTKENRNEPLQLPNF
ncbi:MAG: AAA family ATPase [Planctomycetota bacterium]